MLKIRCKVCGNEVTGSGSCGCPNMASIRNDRVSAVDLSKVIMVESNVYQSENKYLTNQDLMWQEERRQRKVRRIEFEER
jgi:hypothetical protein